MINNLVTLCAAATLVKLFEMLPLKYLLVKCVLSVTSMNLSVNLIGNTMFQPEKSNCHNQQDQLQVSGVHKSYVPVSLIYSQSNKQTFPPFGYLQSIH